MSKSRVTRAVRAAIGQDTQHGAVVPPLCLSSTFSFEGYGKKRKYDYTRSGNPTRDQLAEALADLEGGAHAVVTASGMAAVTLALQLLSPGDLLLAPHDCYGGTHRIMRSLAERGLFRVRFLDLTRPESAAQVRDARAQMVWIETPSNPLLRLTDVTAIAEAAGDAIVVADNTFLSPALQSPLALCADIVVHSTTKYLNGHSDVVGGAVVAKDAALGEKLAWWANCLGITGAPFDSFLTLRGVRTLFARIQIHERNAIELAGRLSQHRAVKQVYYPGLASHPQHELARAQQRGFGGMIAFELKPGYAVERLVAGLSVLTLAESLGGVESLIAHPATMTHAAMGPEARATAGIGDNLLRVSVGIEDADDLWEDLERGLSRARVSVAREARTRRVA